MAVIRVTHVNTSQSMCWRPYWNISAVFVLVPYYYAPIHPSATREGGECLFPPRLTRWKNTIHVANHHSKHLESVGMMVSGSVFAAQEKMILRYRKRFHCAIRQHFRPANVLRNRMGVILTRDVHDAIFVDNRWRDSNKDPSQTRYQESFFDRLGEVQCSKQRGMN